MRLVHAPDASAARLSRREVRQHRRSVCRRDSASRTPCRLRAATVDGADKAAGKGRAYFCGGGPVIGDGDTIDLASCCCLLQQARASLRAARLA